MGVNLELLSSRNPGLWKGCDKVLYLPCGKRTSSRFLSHFLKNRILWEPCCWLGSRNINSPNHLPCNSGTQLSVYLDNYLRIMLAITYSLHQPRSFFLSAIVRDRLSPVVPPTNTPSAPSRVSRWACSGETVNLDSDMTRWDGDQFWGG